MYICMYRYTYIYNIWNVVLMCIIYTTDAILHLYCILHMVYMIYIVYVLSSILILLFIFIIMCDFVCLICGVQRNCGSI